MKTLLLTEPTCQLSIEVRTVDEVLQSLGISTVDFIKLDVEGAEVQDIRTEPWGYRSRAIVEFLANLDYRWFALAPDSPLHPVSIALDSYDANLVALPSERAREFRSLMDRKRQFFPFYQPRPATGRDRGLEILMSMVRVRQGKANFETASHPAANRRGR